MKIKKFKDKEEWLEFRKDKIGGTSLVTLLGENAPYSSPLDLWHVMTGRQSGEIEDNIRMRLGRHLEPAVISYLCDTWGFERIDDPNDLIVVLHEEDERLYGSPDAIVTKEDERYMVECKTTLLAADEPLLKWRLQANYYAGIMGIDKYIIVWLSFPRGDIEYREFDFDKDMYDQCVDEAQAFLHLVEIDTPPEASLDSDYVNYIKSIKGKTVEGDETIEQVLLRLVDEVKAEKAAKEKIDACKLFIKGYMGDSDTLKLGDTKICSFKTSKRVSLDQNKLKKEMPEVYKKYMKESVTRPLTINYKNL